MISLHFVVDFADDKRLQRGLDYLVKTKQRSVNIAGGAQLDRTMQFVEKVRAALPNIVIQFRLLEDTGIIIKLTPEQWFARFVAPRIQWLKDNKIVVVVDNETSGDDAVIRTYVEREGLVADMLHGVNLNGAFCRFATGNITESQYPLLKPLLDKLNAHDWLSPNEYSNAPPLSSGGHLERYKRIEMIAGRPLNMSIGECGVLVGYKARAGYRSINMSGRDMAAQMVSEEMWYKGGSIPRHLYCIGGNSDWSTLQIGDDALEFLEDYYTKNPIAQPDTPPIIVKPIPSPPPPSMVMMPLSVLQDLRKDLQADADMVGRLALQLATLREDISGKLEIVDALIQKAVIK